MGKKITIYSVEKEPIHTKCFVDNDLFKRTMQQIVSNSNLPEFGIKFFIVNKRDKIPNLYKSINKFINIQKTHKKSKSHPLSACKICWA